MQEMLLWLYGKSARNAHIRMMAEKLLKILKEKGSVEHQQLCRMLDIGFDQYQKPKRTFYFVVNPLKKHRLLDEKRVKDRSDSRKYETHYFLTPDRFKGYMEKVVEEFHSVVKS